MDFHTDLEARPWAVYDMGQSQNISRFVIENTTDFAERAAPMAVELSQDGREFKEVAVVHHQFKIWRPKIDRQSARYVRVVSLHQTYFHLRRVEAYR